jgi:hypothetical protein
VKQISRHSTHNGFTKRSIGLYSQRRRHLLPSKETTNNIVTVVVPLDKTCFETSLESSSLSGTRNIHVQSHPGSVSCVKPWWLRVNLTSFHRLT